MQFFCNFCAVCFFWGFPSGTSGKESACQCRRHTRCEFDPLVGKIPWRREWLLTPAFFPGKSHGLRSLAGYSPWGHKELDTTEVTEHAHMLFSNTCQRNPCVDVLRKFVDSLQFYLFICSYWLRRASQVVLAVKTPPANAGDIRDVG